MAGLNIGDFANFGQQQGWVVDIREGGFGKVFITTKVSDDASQAALTELLKHQKRIPSSMGQVSELNAFKTLLDERPSVIDANRFQSEVETWLRVRGCPFLVPAIEVGRFGGESAPFVRMPFFSRSLRKVLRESPNGIGLGNAIGLILMCLEGLKFAQERGMSAHLDLKPENILIADDGGDDLHPQGERSVRPSISDFGLSRLWSVSQRINRGLTVAYAAPEQYEPVDDEQIGPWTDAFALGVILFECITGRHPSGYRMLATSIFSGPQSTKAWERWTYDGLRKDLSAYHLEVPQVLQELLTKCLSVSYRDRPRTYSEMQDVLYAALDQMSPSDLGKAYRTMVEGGQQTTRDLGLRIGTESADVIARRLWDLSRIDLPKARGEAGSLFESALANCDVGNSGESVRLGVLCGGLLAEWSQEKGEQQSAATISGKALHLAFALGNSTAECPSDSSAPYQHIRDRTAHTLAQDILMLVSKANRWGSPADGEQEFETLLQRSRRLAPYLCSQFAGQYSFSRDWGCQFYWKLRAVELRQDEGEFWFIIGKWAWEIATTDLFDEDIGVSRECPHGRRVPWATRDEGTAFSIRALRNAVNYAPPYWMEPKKFLESCLR